MTNIEYGAPIEVAGKPEWLAEDAVYEWKNRYTEFANHGVKPSEYEKAGAWVDISHIRLPATHPYYTVQRYNVEHGTDFVYWPGGDEAPGDWDGGKVLMREYGEGFTSWLSSWKHEFGRSDIIGYRRKPVASTDDTVTVRRMTEAEFVDAVQVGFGVWARSVGIIRPSRIERIAQSTGLTVDQVRAVLDAAKDEAE